ncbi:arsenate reductase [Flavobacterium limnosediminis JC2902]|uniref:Arsenate reductase n=1 Tax=Flavobacterium limnosediminis JC2902 TaxID=1341181 RepID=V6SP66_9FLAO|nr:arsenate reductase (glutaredoxin) [Flavobacterium limnosediminis]ESU28224.1 arsenate reductase [Flavobacterium limnosediminis JC2902]
MITIYHNPRCSKSREGVCFLEEKGIEFNTVKYLDENITVEELTAIIKKLNCKPIELVRTKETLWKENYKDKTLSDKEIITIMAENPVLIERPIIINGDKAVIGRPIEKVLTII